MTQLSLNEARMLAMYDLNPENTSLCVYNPATLTGGNIYPKLFQLIVRNLVARNPDLRVRYEKTASGWGRVERELLPVGAYVPIYENATDEDRGQFGRKNFRPDEQGALFQMAVFCYPDGKTCIDFRGSHLIIDAASARVFYTMIETVYKWAALSYHPYLPVIAKMIAGFGAWFLYREHDDQAIMRRRADARAALEDTNSVTHQYWQRLYEGKAMDYLPSANHDKGEVRPLGYTHTAIFNDSLQKYITTFLAGADKFRGVHFWLASVALLLLTKTDKASVNIPIRIPLARVGLDIGYNSTETVIILSPSYKQNLVEMCGAIRVALHDSKVAQQFPVLQGMGQYAPKIVVNYIEANSDLHLGKAVARLDRTLVAPDRDEAIDCWYEKGTYPIECELGIYPNDRVITSVTSEGHHTIERGQGLLDDLLQLALWAVEHPKTPFQEVRERLAAGHIQH